jgi:hypothetical protein
MLQLPAGLSSLAKPTSALKKGRKVQRQGMAAGPQRPWAQILLPLSLHVEPLTTAGEPCCPCGIKTRQVQGRSFQCPAHATAVPGSKVKSALGPRVEWPTRANPSSTTCLPATLTTTHPPTHLRGESVIISGSTSPFLVGLRLVRTAGGGQAGRPRAEGGAQRGGEWMCTCGSARACGVCAVRLGRAGSHRWR